MIYILFSNESKNVYLIKSTLCIPFGFIYKVISDRVRGLYVFVLVSLCLYLFFLLTMFGVFD